MQIRNKLSLYFTLTSSLLMLVIMSFIYLLFANITRSDFYNELHERTEVAAQLYLEADEISSAALNKIKEKFINSLPGEVIRVYDSANEVSFTADTGHYWNKNIIDEVRSRKYMSYRDHDKQVVGIYYEDNQGNFVILASATDVYGRQRKKQLLEIMATLFAIQILVQFGASRWFAQRALHPRQKVNAQVQKISATDLHLRVTTDSATDELGILAANFNSLLDRLEQSFDLQKMFVANASHELKTPVTNIIGEIEVALNKERTNADYQANLHSVLSEAERLQGIIANFLLLANAENNGMASITEQIRLDELLWDIKEELYPQTGSRLNMQFADLPEDENQLCINGNKALLTLAIKNIVLNALKFSNGGMVTCSLHFSPDAITIRIADLGIGMTAETMNKMFEPFFRSAQVNHYPGHGIGLYITKKIVDMLGGTITVYSQPGHGSTFNITFQQKKQF